MKKIIKLPLPQRYIDKKDIATSKSIEIIGKEKYAQLLNNNLIIVDYETLTLNLKNHKEHILRLNKAIKVLTTLLNQKARQHQFVNPNQCNQSHIYKHHQQPSEHLDNSLVFPQSLRVLYSVL